MYNNGWTDERTELLQQLWSDGWSCSLIAEELGGGIIRNAVIGKVHRLGLKRESTTESQKPRLRAKKIKSSDQRGTDPYVRQARPQLPQRFPMMIGSHIIAPRKGEVKEPTEILASTFVCSDPVSFDDLRLSHCRWPIGDTRVSGFGFCGAERRDEKTSYCAHHHRIAYIQSTKVGKELHRFNSIAVAASKQHGLSSCVVLDT
jgi:GcrA cell cycle regulator